MDGRGQLEGQCGFGGTPMVAAEGWIVPQAELEERSRLPSPRQARAHSTRQPSQHEQKRLESNQSVVPFERHLDLARELTGDERLIIDAPRQSQNVLGRGTKPRSERARRQVEQLSYVQKAELGEPSSMVPGQERPQGQLLHGAHFVAG